MKKYNYYDLNLILILSAFVTLILGIISNNLNANQYEPDSIKGMSIENFEVFDDSYRITTTGAIFQINHKINKIVIYQRIGIERKLAEITITTDFNSVLNKMPQDNGFEYVWSKSHGKKDFKFIISGDSLIRFYNLKEINIRYYFSPIFKKVNPANNGLIALDDVGGIAIMPPNNISLNNYQINVEDNEWKFNSNSKMPILFVGICPPRPFDWERSHWPIIHYSSHLQRYPSDQQIDEYSNYAKVLEIHQWVWKNRYVNNYYCSQEHFTNCDGLNTPLWQDNSASAFNKMYIPEDEKELIRVISQAHEHKMLVAVYFYGSEMNQKEILREIKRLRSKYDIDGIYLDGLLAQTKDGPLDAYLTARELRKIFGDDGWINYHNSHNGYFAPFVQTYMDFVTTSEHDNFDRWTSTTFNISNAIGGLWPEILYFWPDSTKNIEDARPFLKNLVDLSLKFHNRILFLTGEQGQWRFWRLYFTPEEMKFLKEYYLNQLGSN